jgi:membrane associated rhomboid family serine protease
MARRRVSNIEQSLRILLAGLGGFLLTFALLQRLIPVMTRNEAAVAGLIVAYVLAVVVSRHT